MREWLVIESSASYGVFASDEMIAKRISGYIPRDSAEKLLGRSLGDRNDWFRAEEGEKMRAHPEWRDTPPPGKDAVKPCTCHPSDNPPVPCPQKYALRECREAAAADEIDRLTLALAASEAVIAAAEKVNAATFSHIDGRDLLAELHPRSELDIKRRVDGQDKWFEGDWLTTVYREIKPLRDALKARDAARKRAEATEEK